MKKRLLFFIFLISIFLAVSLYASSHVSARITGFTVAMPNLGCPEYNAEELRRSCESEGKSFSTQLIDSCEYPVCSSLSSVCTETDALEQQKEACKSAGKESYFVYDSANCPKIECRSFDNFNTMPGFEKKMVPSFPQEFSEMKCSPESMFKGMETMCAAKGGKFSTKESNGCMLPSCDFGNQMPSSFFSCPAVNKEEIENKCKAIGLPVKIMSAGGCETLTCGEPDGSQCPQISKEEIKMCDSSGMELASFVLSNGCKAFKCVPKEQFNSICMKEVPAEWEEKCKLKGGSIYTKTDDKGCIVNAQCTAEESVEFEEIDSEDFSVAEALDLALKLEELEIKFSDVAEKCVSLEKYYQTKNNENKAAIFNKCSAIFNSASGPIQEIRDLLKQEPLTKEILTEAKIKVKELKNTLKQVLHLFLNQDASGATAAFTEGSCEDMSCFEKCLKSCSECTFTIPEGVEAEISGLEGGKCIMSAEAKTEQAESMFGKFMKCRITDFAAGFSGKKFEECTGPMAEKMKQMEQNSNRGFSQ